MTGTSSHAARKPHRERVLRAIRFCSPDRVPVWNINRDETEGDVLRFDLRLWEDAGSGSHWRDGNRSEWGYLWRDLQDGTMGQPVQAIVEDLDDAVSYRFPPIDPDRRFANLKEWMGGSEGYYRLGMAVINGFTTYSFLRGFENAMMDFALRDPRALKLLKGVFDWERRLICACAAAGFDGYHLGDDWGAQRGLIISPGMWKELFMPLYRELADCCHAHGMQLWFHSCGDFTDIIPLLHDAGVDVINIAQPNAVDIEKVGAALRGKQAFLVPLSYQTTSISGSREDILGEAARLYTLLGIPEGGFIGYTEDYGCMGMTDTNFHACKEAFRLLGNSDGKRGYGQSVPVKKTEAF